MVCVFLSVGVGCMDSTEMLAAYGGRILLSMAGRAYGEPREYGP